MAGIQFGQIVSFSLTLHTWELVVTSEVERKMISLLGHQISYFIYLEEPIGYPAQPELIRLSVCLSGRPSVHACRLGIQRKMAQAQQIWSIIHESM